MKLKRLTSLLIAGCMMTSMLPVSAVTAFAEDSTGTSVSASESITTYEQLQNAIANALDGAKIVLEGNITGGVTIPEGKNITLDLNGHTIEATGTVIDNAGTLTVTDSKGTGEIVSTGNVGIAVESNSSTTIDFVKITGQEGAVITSRAVGATITINDGVFTAIDNAVVAGNGTERPGDPNKITINGGTFNGGITTSGYVACGIYAPWKDEITVNNGTFNITGGAGIVARAGSVTVNGGTFKTTGDTNTKGWVGDSKNVVPCSALVFDSAANYPAIEAASAIKVIGGTFQSAAGVEAITVTQTDTNKRVAVYNGTFSTNPKEYCEDGDEIVDNNGVFTVNPKIDDAASSSGAGAGAVVAGVAIGTGVAVLTYHIGTEIYAKQVLGAGVAVPKTREEVALKAWELAGKPAVAAEGETLSDTEQAERWVVESGLMKNDANGSFNGQKRMFKLGALRTLDAAKKLG
ncbi:MAG: hypothetical protein MR633_00675 [Faecalibacterium prausnitzii]|nr:hypothetical protein [Faecalibacterium prausnitzii]